MNKVSYLFFTLLIGILILSMKVTEYWYLEDMFYNILSNISIGQLDLTIFHDFLKKTKSVSPSFT